MLRTKNRVAWGRLGPGCFGGSGLFFFRLTFGVLVVNYAWTYSHSYRRPSAKAVTSQDGSDTFAGESTEPSSFLEYSMRETWRPLAAYEGYEVSNLGRVASRLNGNARRILTPAEVRGYLRVGLRRFGQSHSEFVHKLVLLAFVGECPIGFQCRHNDGNRKNNRLSNLCWGTPKDNAADRALHGKTIRGEKHRLCKLTAEKVLKIRADGRRNSFIARSYGVSESTVFAIKNRRAWKWLD